MTGALMTADEVPRADGDVSIANRQVVHQPCGCVWLDKPRRFAASGSPGPPHMAK
jgi:hypothetical protein